jgi:hypothetical protein
MTPADLPRNYATRITVTPAGEWIWCGAVSDSGYPTISIAGKTQLAHRAVYKMLVGPIPAGLTLDHVRARGCTTTLCVWPAHLEPVTSRVNNLRGNSPAAVNYRKDKCIRGHAFDLFNTSWRVGGGRACRQCAHDRGAA